MGYGNHHDLVMQNAGLQDGFHINVGSHARELREQTIYRGTAQPTPSLVVVVLVPITILVPAVVVFIPPLMPLPPTTLLRVVQFTALVICLMAIASVFVNCLVEFMLRMSDSALTSGLVFSLRARHCAAKQKCFKTS